MHDGSHNGTGRIMRGLFTDYASRHPLLTVAGFASLLVVPAQDIVLPLLTGRMVRAIGRRDMRSLRTLGCLVVTAMAVLQLAYVGLDLVDSHLYPSMHAFFRNRIINGITSNLRREYVEPNVGSLLHALSVVPSTMAYWFEAGKKLLPHIIVYVAATAYFCCAIDVVLGVGVGVVLGASCIGICRGVKGCGIVAADSNRGMSDMQESTEEYLRNMTAVLEAGRISHERSLLDSKDAAFRDAYLQTAYCSLRSKAWMVPSAVALVAFSLWRSWHLMARRHMDVAKFVVVALVVFYIMASMMRTVVDSRMLAMHWGVVASSVGLLAGDEDHDGDGDHAGEDHDGDHAGDGDHDGEEDRDGELAVSIRGLYKHALHGLDLDVRRGERVVVMGPIGSGKTTLLRCLMRLARPEAGRMFLHGVLFDRMSPDVVRENFVYIPQQPTLFNRSIMDNVLYGSGLDGANETVRATVWSAAQHVGIADAIASLPDGMDTLAGKGGDTLSGGQRQMVWLLRAMMRRQPVVLLMDEPTAALDDASKQSLQAAIGVFDTAIIVTHDHEFADAIATRIVRIAAHP